MDSIGSYEAKTHLPSLLERVAKGEEFMITKHGVPIARLVPVKQEQQHDVRAVIEELKKFRKGHTLGGLSIREMIIDTLRSKDALDSADRASRGRGFLGETCHNLILATVVLN